MTTNPLLALLGEAGAYPEDGQVLEAALEQFRLIAADLAGDLAGDLAVSE